MNHITICGVSFTAVRKQVPRPHWRVRVDKTGEVWESGVVCGDSRPKMWADLKRIHRVIGDERFIRDTIGG